MSLGLAISVKVTWVIPSVFVVGLALWESVKHHNKKFSFWGFILLILPFLWMILNIAISGYPLGSIPVNLLGVTLGKASPNFQWFMNRPELEKIYSFSLINTLSPVIAQTLLAMAGFISILFSQRLSLKVRLLFIAVITGVLISYFSPKFTLVRLKWTDVNARFLFSPSCP